MEATETVNGQTLSVDPKNAFPETPVMDIIDSCGPIPMWLNNYACKVDEDPATGIQAFMEQTYRQGELNTVPGSVVVTDEQYLTDPGVSEPDLPPLLTYKGSNGAEFIMWQFAVCAMRQTSEDEWFITLIDLTAKTKVTVLFEHDADISREEVVAYVEDAVKSMGGCYRPPDDAYDGDAGWFLKNNVLYVIAGRT